MTSPRHALVTPSYRGDYERCRLLCESVDRWVAPEVPHYLVIERRDLAMFRPFESARTHIVVVEDIVPWWIRRVPGFNRFWFSLTTPPIRNWIMQQIVKLSVAEHLKADVLLFVDSDVFFIAPYDPRAEMQGGLVPLFVETGQRGKISFNDRWHSEAATLLGLAVEDSYDTNFVGQVICWRSDVAKRLQQQMTETTGLGWVRAIARRWVISEYIIYGLYVTRIVGLEAAGHYASPVEKTCCYWDPVPLDAEGLQKLRGRLEPHHHSVMISSKSNTPMDAIRRAFL